MNQDWTHRSPRLRGWGPPGFSVNGGRTYPRTVGGGSFEKVQKNVRYAKAMPEGAGLVLGGEQPHKRIFEFHSLLIALAGTCLAGSSCWSVLRTREGHGTGSGASRRRESREPGQTGGELRRSGGRDMLREQTWWRGGSPQRGRMCTQELEPGLGHPSSGAQEGSKLPSLRYPSATAGLQLPQSPALNCIRCSSQHPLGSQLPTPNQSGCEPTGTSRQNKVTWALPHTSATADTTIAGAQKGK